MEVNAEEIEKAKQQIIESFGPWSGHCIHLGHDVYTWEGAWATPRVRRYLQVAADLLDEPLSQHRVLDLACLEGHFGIEFALHGSEVVAIEGREANIAKARFAKETLSLDNLELILDDVRHLDAARYGTFDVVLCLGILYHLDAPDVMEFLERIASVCRRFAIIDTHVALEAEDSSVWRGHTFWGRFAKEHEPTSTDREKVDKLWYSLDNVRAFQFTRESLCNLLQQVGFTSVYQCLNPYVDGESVNRITLVAFKGKRHTVLSSPITQSSPILGHPEASLPKLRRPRLRSVHLKPLTKPVRRLWKRIRT